METAVAKIILDLYGCQNPREKKRIITPFIDSIRKKFNVSISEVDDFDDPERTVIGLSVTASDINSAKNKMSGILKHIDTNAPARMVFEDTEIYSFD